MLRHYLLDRPAGEQVLLIGYSTGADVLPFIVNHLPEDLRARVASVTLIAPGFDAEFQIRLTDWIRGSAPSGTRLLPEAERLSLPLLCVYGQGDQGVLCPALPVERATTALVGTGHHLGGEYEEIAERILSFTGSTAR